MGRGDRELETNSVSSRSNLAWMTAIGHTMHGEPVRYITNVNTDFIGGLKMLNDTCLWCTIKAVSERGGVCSYECYAAWINWHQERDGDIIKVEEGMNVMLPLELQTFYQRTWEDRG